MRQYDGEADSRLLDVTDRGKVDRVVAETVERFGGIDVMVYCTGTNIPERWQSMPAR